MSHSHEQDADHAVLVQLAFFEFSTGAPHPLSTTYVVSFQPLSEFREASVHAEVLGEHVLITVSDRSSKADVYLVSWKTGTLTLVSGFSKPCSVFNPHECLKLRKLPERSTAYHNGGPMALFINSSLVSLVEGCENGLEICKLKLDPSPQLRTLCFLDLPRLAPNASHFFVEAYREWVPTSKSYTQTRSSREYHLPFYSSAIGTIALHFQYRVGFDIPSSYAFIINVAALVSAIPTDVRNVPWKDWGPSSTHLFEMEITQLAEPLTSVGPFWIICHSGSELVVRQYDLRCTQCTRLMAGDTSIMMSRLLWDDTPKIFRYDIETVTHLPYRDVKMKDELVDYIVADREWVVGVTQLVRRTFDHTVRCDSDHSHR